MDRAPFEHPDSIRALVLRPDGTGAETWDPDCMRDFLPFLGQQVMYAVVREKLAADLQEGTNMDDVRSTHDRLMSNLYQAR